MDDLSNYANLTSGITEQNTQYKDQLKNLGDTMKEHIKEIAEPIGAGFFVEGAKTALTTSINNFGKTLAKKGGDAKDVMGMVKAYKDGGVKGLVKHLRGGGEASQEAGSVGKEVGTNISDLSPSEWDATGNTISTALKARGQTFSDSQRSYMSKKYQNEKLEAGDEPDEALRQQGNAQKMNDIMDETEQRAEAFGSKNLLQNPAVRQLAGGLDDDDALLNVAQKTISGASKTVSALDKTVIAAANKASIVPEKEIVEKAGKKALTRAAEEDDAEGGEENVVGDVISGIVGVATFLGGVFGASRKPDPVVGLMPANVSYQSGI